MKPINVLTIRLKKKFQLTLEKLKNSYYLQFVLLLTIVGIGIRIYQFASLRSLWLDEAMLARNIIDRSMLDLLFQPLDYNQGAPLLFLFIEKLFTYIFGRNDIALRLFPFVCGVLIIPLSIHIATKIFGKVAGGVTGILIISNSQLIYYSSEVKQYSVDAFIILFVICCFINWFERKLSTKNYWEILIVGIISSILSHPNLFIFGGFAIVLWIKTLIEIRKTGRKQDFYKLSGVLFTWGVLYGGLYLLTLNDLASNNHLINYWSNGFMPMPPWENLDWFRSLPSEFTRSLLNGQYKTHRVFLVLTILGAILLWKKNKNFSFSVIIIGIGMLIASAMRLYPLEGRMLIFSIPLVVLFISGGIQAFYNLLVDYQVIAWTLSALLCVFVTYGSFSYMNNFVRNPEMRLKEEVKPLIEILEDERQENEALYVYYVTAHAYQYYQTISGREDYLVFYGERHRLEPEKYIEEIDQMSDFSTIWILFSHNYGNEKDIIQDHFEEIGDMVETHSAYGAFLSKYQIDNE